MSEATTTRPQVKQVRVSEVITLLKSGYTRWENEAFETEKSIQTHFGLSFSECKELFAHPKIKGLKVKIPTMLIIDDTVEGTESVTSVGENEVEEQEQEQAITVQEAPELVESAIGDATPVEAAPEVAVPVEDSLFDE